MPIKSIETSEESGKVGDIMVVTFTPDTSNEHLASLERRIRQCGINALINGTKLAIQIVREDVIRTLAILVGAERAMEGDELRIRVNEVIGRLDEKLQELFLGTHLVQPPDGIGRPYIEVNIINLPITEKSDNNLIGLLTVDQIADLAKSENEQVISEGVIIPAVCAKLGEVIKSAINKHDDLLAEVDTDNGIRIKISAKMPEE